MYDFYIYEGKNDETQNDNDYSHLQKSAQVVARLSKDLPGGVHHKLFFDNWFSTLDLMLYLKSMRILAVGTIRLNRIGKCPIDNNKSLQKSGRGSMDYRTDNNSGIVIVKWIDNSVVQLISNFVGIEPMSEITRWCKTEKARKEIPCPQIVKQYNKSMGGVDLADMLIALYRIPCKTKRWYQKIFWHLIDIAKVNAWILYRRHANQRQVPSKDQKSLLVFSSKIADALIHANKVVQPNCRGRPSKRKSVDPIPRGKKPIVALPIHDIRYDQIGHWPTPVTKKNRCRNCEMTCRMMCEKCNIYLCLIDGRNCFKDFHTS